MTRYRRAWVLTTWIYGETRGKVISRQLLGALERRGVRVTTRAAATARLYLYSFARR
jgi:hypothetical protein